MKEEIRQKEKETPTNDREERSSERTGFRKRIKKDDGGGDFDKLSHNEYQVPAIMKETNRQLSEREGEFKERPKRSYERDTTEKNLSVRR
jgi:hypothetical protein